MMLEIYVTIVKVYEELQSWLLTAIFWIAPEWTRNTLNRMSLEWWDRHAEKEVRGGLTFIVLKGGFIPRFVTYSYNLDDCAGFTYAGTERKPWDAVIYRQPYSFVVATRRDLTDFHRLDYDMFADRIARKNVAVLNRTFKTVEQVEDLVIKSMTMTGYGKCKPKPTPNWFKRVKLAFLKWLHAPEIEEAKVWTKEHSHTVEFKGRNGETLKALVIEEPWPKHLERYGGVDGDLEDVGYLKRIRGLQQGSIYTERADIDLRYLPEDLTFGTATPDWTLTQRSISDIALAEYLEYAAKHTKS